MTATIDQTGDCIVILSDEALALYQAEVAASARSAHRHQISVACVFAGVVGFFLVRDPNLVLELFR